jgi:hypothetical protein
MNCEEFWDGMPELKGQQLLSCEETAHIGGCPDCAQLLSRQRSLVEGLGKVAADLRRVEAPAHLEARLAEAFRRESRVVPIPARRPWLPALTWASVGVVAALIAMVLFLTPKHNPAPSRHSAHHNSGAVELAALQSPLEMMPDDDNADASDGFIPLPNAAQVGPNEDVNVVRVEMPRSAMMAVGIDVSDDRATERVEADVMLGSDGLPRAVRFVGPEGY